MSTDPKIVNVRGDISVDIKSGLASKKFEDLEVVTLEHHRIEGGYSRCVPVLATMNDMVAIWDIDNKSADAEICQIMRYLRQSMKNSEDPEFYASKISIADRIFASQMAQNKLRSNIDKLFKLHHPEFVDPLDPDDEDEHELNYTVFNISYELDFDWYDSSIEVYFEDDIPYPWEPHPAVRRGIMDMGFDTIFWNFKDMGDGPEEIRGCEPRRFSQCEEGQEGWLDDRFDKERWTRDYGNKLKEYGFSPSEIHLAELEKSDGV